MMTRTDTKSPSSRKLLSIQIMRGVAAVFVVALHVYTIFMRPEYGALIAFETVVSKGWIGVNFFFVISGFIIMNAHHKDIGHPNKILNYLWKRFTRLYPLYWILVTVFMIAASFGLGNYDFTLDFPNMVTTFSLLNVRDMPLFPLKVAWTLLFEVKFYIVFILLLYSKRLGTTVILGWGIAILVRNAFTPLPDWGYVLPDWGMLHMWNIHFLTGIIAWGMTRLVHKRYGMTILLAGIACLCVAYPQLTVMDTDTRRPLMMLALAVTFGLVVAGGVLYEQQSRFSPPSFFILLGDASYSIYLVHSAALSLMATIYMKWFQGEFSAPTIYVATGIAAITVGTMCHLILERPLLQAIRKHRPVMFQHPTA